MYSILQKKDQREQIYIGLFTNILTEPYKTEYKVRNC
jgi:hypothetical protein